MKIKILDGYFKRPYLWDFLICLIIFVGFYLNRSFYSKSTYDKGFDNIFSSIMSSLVSFAGFITTALTVIVTVKSSLQIRDGFRPKNGLELILTSSNYEKIIKVFKYSIIELVICIIILYLLWIPYFKINYWIALALISSSFFVIISSLYRSLYVFFNTIFLEFKGELT